MSSLNEPFANGDSILHRLNPCTRIICAALFTIPCALLKDMQAAEAGLTIGLLMLFAANLPLEKVFKRLLVVNVFTCFLWLFIPFSMPGHSIAKWGPLSVTQEGIQLATLITIKSNAIVCALMALIGTIPIHDLGPALQQLKIPNKICHILLFSYRYIFVIYQEYKTMRRAMSARGFQPGTNTHTYKSYAWLVGMLLIKSWDRAERVQNAMRCRGFNGNFYTLTTFNTTRSDFIIITTCCTATLIIILLELVNRGIL